MTNAIASAIDALQRMTTNELLERYAELHGEPSRTRHRTYLIRKIAWRIQANAEGDLSERARKRAAELADDADRHFVCSRRAAVRALRVRKEHTMKVSRNCGPSP